MLSFKQFIVEMAERSPERAAKLLDRVRKPFAGDQIDNIIKKPKVTLHDYENGAKYKGKRVQNWHPLIAKDGKLEEIPLGAIRSSQPTVSKDVLLAKLNNTWSKPDQPRHPYVIHHRGEYHMFDGNHQTGKARLLGKKTIKARVLRADDD